MGIIKQDRKQILRAIESLPDYPAVLTPTVSGGFEVIFPNLPRTRAYGQTRDLAVANGVEALTAEMGLLVGEGQPAPKPSSPERLIAGEDEPAGTEMVLLSPDKLVLRRRFGLQKSSALDLGLGRLGRPK